MARDNEVVIEARVAKTKAERDLAELQKELEYFDSKSKRLAKQKIQLEIKKEKVEEANRELQKYNNYLERAKQKVEAAQNAWQTSRSSEAYQNFQKMEDLATYLEQEVTKYAQELKKANKEYEESVPQLMKINEAIKRNEAAQGKVAKRIQETNEKIKQQQLSSITQQMKELGKGTENVIKKVARWGLALFGVRSAYNFIRQSMSTLSQYNEKLAADLQYIRFAVASSLENIINNIVALMYKLLQYVNYIAQAWFGVNLFANASTKAFEKQNKALGGSVKQAKELKKQLTGIDEMNILQDSGDVSSGGGGGGATLPSADLSQMIPQEEIPGWIKWIADNGDILKTIIADIGFAFAGWKILELISNMKLLKGEFTGLEKTLMALGIGRFFQGLWDIISKWGEDVSGVIGGFGETIEGIGLFLVGINPNAWWSWAILGVGFVVDLISHLIDVRSDTEKLKDAQEDLNKATQEYVDAQKNELNAFKNAKKAREDLIKTGKDLGYTEEETMRKGKELYDMVQNYGIGAFDNMTDADKKVYEAYLNDMDAQKRLQKTSEQTVEARKNEADANLEVLFYLGKTKGAWSDYGDAVVEAYKRGDLSAKDAAMAIQGALWKMDEDAKKTFAENFPIDIGKTQDAFGGLVTGIFVGNKELEKEFEKIPKYMDKPKQSVSDLLGIFKNLKNIMSSINGTKVNVTTSGSSKSYPQAKGGIVTRLATGAIVNQPGRGIPVASSYMGEAGREGILPLTDSQAMETLGQAIGKYISLNATIPVYVGNRQVARELKRIEAEDDFAYNG